ncbi:protein containing Diguanylate phosphodiesterase, predicted [Rhodopirellula maiorica SM1]|uniref:Protein containing Diguanylate phosphodiesterase, predicted n=1 Tax=Rhodopirellula maiorica SM1 TaxID=1265738 RepID=M5RQX4_9BACT|nr:EAL domain-containing protein [Rhodopirellula maiorica]EMI21700.1 protein containing Diguanylate phosphodiesterase, predicted [Rhodopirellula maiorica SM1]
MNLRLKILLSLIAVFITYVVIDTAIHQYVVLPRFVALEQFQATKDLQRCHDSIQRDVDNLHLVLDLPTEWDTLQDYVDQTTDCFQRRSQLRPPGSDQHLDMFAVVNHDGKVVYQCIHPPASKGNVSRPQQASVTSFPEDDWTPKHPVIKSLLSSPKGVAAETRGIITTAAGPMIVLGRPIFREGDDRVEGACVVGRFLDRQAIAAKAEQADVTFQVDAIDRLTKASPELVPASLRGGESRGNVVAAAPISIRELDDDHLVAEGTLLDIQGNPVLSTYAFVRRNISQEGRIAMHYAIGSLVAAAFVVLSILLLLLQQIVINPLNQLSQHATRMGETGNFSARSEINRDDEFGDLATNLDTMVGRLKQLCSSNQQLHVEIRQRKSAESELQHAATHDSLTNLPNRTHLKRMLESRFANRTFSAGNCDALIFLDLDNFKIINDSLGHAVGDQLLVAIGERLQAAVDSVSRHSETKTKNLVARLGGDEFVIFLGNVANEEVATEFAEQIRTDLIGRYTVSGHELTLGTSLGIAFSNDSVTTPEELMRNADLAMYRAKFSGKQCLAVFDHAMHESVLKRLELEEALRTVLKDGGLRLVYQPIFDVETGVIVGLESLVRWDHATKGLISPAEFVPVAEEIGLIVPIGRWILEEACRTIHRLNEARGDGPPISIGVNVSKRQLADSGFVDLLRDVLETENVSPNQLNLEITESMIMDSPEQIVDCLSEIRNLGIRLHMDDFGTGHSSLSCLHRFPIDVLKIDRSFVSTMEVGDDYESIIHAIITLAHNLDTKVIAEGIETTRQLQQLRDLKCDFGQGYLYSKPEPIEDLQELLSAVVNQPRKDPQFGFASSDSTFSMLAPH